MFLPAPHVARVKADAAERAALELARLLGDSVVSCEASALEGVSRDESETQGVLPDIVVFARNAGDLAETLRVAAKHDVPVTPRAGGSGRAGGAIPLAGGIVLCTEALDQIKDIDARNRVAVVEPGLMTRDLHRAVEALGLFYPPDPNSLEWCRIGGNVATNAGGPRAYKYGVTRNYVLGTEVQLMGGEVLRTGRRTKKGVTGYDATALLVGSEGTLGVFSELTLALVAKPPLVATVLALFSDDAAALGAVVHLQAAGLTPRCIEYLDAVTCNAVRAKGVALDLRAQALLLMDLDGAALDAELERHGEVLLGCAGIVDVQVAQDAARRDALWNARRALSPTTRALAKFKISEDVVVPITEMAHLVSESHVIAERNQIRSLVYGHAGDGNLHVNFLFDDTSEMPRVKQALLELMQCTLGLGGTLTGEHGIGTTKLAYLHLEQDAGLRALQLRLKAAFDPRGLLNPGKAIVATHAC
jgi:glycolate oxidase